MSVRENNIKQGTSKFLLDHLALSMHIAPGLCV